MFSTVSLVNTALSGVGELSSSARGFLPWVLAGILVFVALVALLADRRRLLQALESETIRRREAEEHQQITDLAKIEFMASMSHEIRTPINAVLGTTELLAAEQLSLASREHVATIETSAQALLSLVDDLLDMSRSEAGLLRLRPVDFRLKTLVGDVLRLVGQRAAAKGLEVQVALEGEPQELHGDVARLRQVLCNLVNNAIRFTTEGQIKILARVEGEADSLRRLRFEVADTGIGISPRLRARLFEPFAYGESSVAQRRGSGLGLAVSKKLIELMGGEIGVGSNVGAGSVFWFQVPVSSARAPLPALAEVGLPRFETTSRLLVVEDNPINQQVILGQLNALGLEADTSDDGHAAIDALSRNRYAAVLLDVFLPGLDGYDTTRRYRQLEQEKGLPSTVIIAITAHAVDGEKERCLAAGMDDFLAKPFRLLDLAEVLTRYLPVVEVRDPSSLRIPVQSLPSSPATATYPTSVTAPAVALPTDTGVMPVVQGDLTWLDPAVLDELRGLSAKAHRDLIGTLAASFGPNARKLLDKIAEGLAANDAEAIRGASHQLKSAAGNIGARVYAELAKRVEYAARSNDLAAIPADLRLLIDELPLVEKALFEAAKPAEIPPLAELNA